MAKKSQKDKKFIKFLKRFNPKTTKHKMFAFVFVFALLGGGYFVYSSFAASVSYRIIYMPTTSGYAKWRDSSGQTGVGPHTVGNARQGKFTYDGVNRVFINSVNDGTGQDLGFGGEMHQWSKTGMKYVKACVSAKQIKGGYINKDAVIKVTLLADSPSYYYYITGFNSNVYSERCSATQSFWGAKGDYLQLDAMAVTEGVAKVYYVRYNFSSHPF